MKKNTKIEEVKADVAKIVEEAKITNFNELWTLIDARFKALEEKIACAPAPRTGRVASTRAMTEDDAKRVMTGDLKDKSIKECLTTLGLSYGQVYSARGGYTFKTQYAERQASLKAVEKK